MSDDPRNEAVRRTVSRARWVSIGLAAVLSPIPLADELALLPVYGWMTARIGKAHGLAIAAVPWRPIGTTIVAGLAARAGINVAFSMVPGVAAVANAVSAAALTEAIGRYADEACANPMAARAVRPAW